MKKTCVIVQSLGLGDAIICGPIAEFYHKLGYTVYWPSREPFLQILRKYPYVVPVELSGEVRHSDSLRSDRIKTLELDIYKNADLILDLADRGEEQEQKPWENFEQFKYKKAAIPLENKHFLNWTRNHFKEKALKDLVCPPGDYVFAHRGSSHNDLAEFPAEETRPVVEVREIEGFDIFDWFLIIKNSAAIYCTESCFQTFVDGAINHFPQPKYLLRRSSLNPGERYVIGDKWDHKYIGETRLRLG
jgi:hypothetical protein